MNRIISEEILNKTIGALLKATLPLEQGLTLLKELQSLPTEKNESRIKEDPITSEEAFPTTDK